MPQQTYSDQQEQEQGDLAAVHLQQPVAHLLEVVEVAVEAAAARQHSSCHGQPQDQQHNLKVRFLLCTGPAVPEEEKGLSTRNMYRLTHEVRIISIRNCMCCFVYARSEFKTMMVEGCAVFNRIC